MARWHPERLAITLVVVFTFSLILYGSLTDSKLIAFKITPLAFASIDGFPDQDIQVPFKAIYCNAKSSNIIKDSTSKTIGDEQSPFKSDYPVVLFDFTDVKSGTQQFTYTVIPKLKCETSKTGSFNALFHPVELPLIILPSDLKLKVYSKDMKGSEFASYTRDLKTKQFELTKYQDYELGSFFINPYDFLKDFPQGNYNSFQRFTVSGDIKMQIKGSSQVYVMHINEKDIETYREIKITKVDVPTITCKDDEIVENGMCKKKQVEEQPVQEPEQEQEVETEFKLTGNLFADFENCIKSGSKECLALTAFMPIYVFFIGFMLVVGAMLRKPRQVMYGVPPSY